jgi:GT2 family glycosyltransferase
MVSRIKKLTKLSLDIIKTYGLSYYLHVAIEELENQKLDLLRDDNVKSRKLEADLIESDTQKYKAYIEKLDLDITDKNVLENQLNYKPKFTIIIPSNKINLKYIEPLFTSIKEQVYDNYEIIILQSDDNLKNLIIQNLDHANNNKAISSITFISKINDIQKNIHGDFVCILEPGSKLDNNALFKTCEFLNKNIDSEIIYTDNDNLDESGNRINPFFKPDWSPYLFFSMNYLSPLCFIRKEIFAKLSINEISSSTLHYEVILKATEVSKKIKHLSLPLCSVLQKSFSNQFLEKKNVLSSYFERKKINVTVGGNAESGVFNIKFNFENNPLVSIIIPTKNNKKILNRCIESIKKNTSYKNFEIIIVDNNSTSIGIKSYYKSLSCTILDYKDSFNFSKMNNYAVKHAKGDFLLFLNDDTKILEPNWLQEMIGVCSQNDVGAVGAKLVYSDNTIQHAGIVILDTGAGFHPFQNVLEYSNKYFNLINVMRDCSAVTGACLMTKKEIFTKINGFDDAFDLYYGDADLCLRIIDSGYHVVYTPLVKLLHEGSHSIKTIINFASVEQTAHFAVENHFQFIKKWPLIKNGDQFYNKNLGWDHSIKHIEY